MFKISKQQLAGLRAGKLEESRWRVLAYLRETAPDFTWERDNESLYMLVRDYEASGRAAGLRSERAHAKWAYLMLTTGGQFDAPPVRAALADPDQGSADLALDRIMAAMVELASADSESVG